jgi:hypothetical protein
LRPDDLVLDPFYGASTTGKEVLGEMVGSIHRIDALRGQVRAEMAEA